MCLLYTTCFDIGVHCRITKSSSWCITSCLFVSDNWKLSSSFQVHNILVLMTVILFDESLKFMSPNWNFVSFDQHFSCPLSLCNYPILLGVWKYDFWPPGFACEIYLCIILCVTVAYSFSMVDNSPVHGYAVITYDRQCSTLVRILLIWTFVFIFPGEYVLHYWLSMCILLPSPKKLC